MTYSHRRRQRHHIARSRVHRIAGTPSLDEDTARRVRTRELPLAAPAGPLEPPSGAFPGGQVAVTTPNGKTLPWTQRDGVKIGHLVAEPVDHEFAPGLRGIVWGYNGGTPGPTLEAVEGDRLRIYVTNRLPEPTTVHWHGLIIPNGMDGVSGLNQKPIPPGETWVYEFTVKHPGTYMYHSHYDEMVQIALGLTGMFVVHPKRLRGPRVDRDFVLMTHEWKLETVFWVMGLMGFIRIGISLQLRA